jgi:hypothetical protein
MTTQTTNLGLNKPAAGDTDWAQEVNDNWDTLDSKVVVVKAIDHTWEGDGANDRVIDLGDDYDFILVWQEEDGAYNTDHCAMPYAFKNCYGNFYEHSTDRTSHNSMTSANSHWQGKMTGADASKIKTGTLGSSIRGTNYSGYTYRLLGLKFSNMQ